MTAVRRRRGAWLAALVALPVILSASSVHGQSPSPGASAVPPPAIVWDSGAVRLAAAAVRIDVNGLSFSGAVPEVAIHSDTSSVTSRTLELEWVEQDRAMRLTLYLAADDRSWWISEIRTYDGAPQGSWVSYPAPAWRIPIGGSWQGDLALASGSSTLLIQGASLRAFAPDTLPAEQRFCRPAVEAGLADATDPLAEGQPLAGSGILELSTVAARQLLFSRGLCHTFRYSYGFGDGQGGYSELWCDPPQARITGVRYGSDGEVIVFTEDAVPQPHTPRPQPPVGWGC